MGNNILKNTCTGDMQSMHNLARMLHSLNCRYTKTHHNHYFSAQLYDPSEVCTLVYHMLDVLEDNSPSQMNDCTHLSFPLWCNHLEIDALIGWVLNTNSLVQNTHTHTRRYSLCISLCYQPWNICVDHWQWWNLCSGNPRTWSASHTGWFHPSWNWAVLAYFAWYQAPSHDAGMNLHAPAPPTKIYSHVSNPISWCKNESACSSSFYKILFTFYQTPSHDARMNLHVPVPLTKSYSGTLILLQSTNIFTLKESAFTMIVISLNIHL